jgi:uncharacterized protein (TIGR02453 family)
MLQKSTIQFLKGLEKNNNKPWFDAHREAYESARADFSVFVQKIIDQSGKKDAGIKNLTAKECIYRINRDIRFSKDKTPYKNHFGAYINQGGKKSLNTAGYYIHLQPGNTFVGGGIWMPESPMLQKLRQEIDYNLTDFEKIIGAASFRKTYGGLSQNPEYKLSRVPKGYEPDNPAAEYLKFKSYVATAYLKDEEVFTSFAADWVSR